MHWGKRLGDTFYEDALIRHFGAFDTLGPNYESYLCFSLIELVASSAQVFPTTYFILELFGSSKVGELVVDNLSSTCSDGFLLS